MRFVFLGSRFTLHASFPRSVTLAQLRFACLTVASSAGDLHPEDRAHAGRTVPRRQPTAAGSSFTSRIRFPTILGWHRRCLRSAANGRAATTVRVCFAVGSANLQQAVGGPPAAAPMQCRGAQSSWPARASALRALTRCGCLSVANASSRSEFRNGVTRSSTTGYPACKAGRCIRSRRRWPTLGPLPHSNADRN